MSAWVEQRLTSSAVRVGCVALALPLLALGCAADSDPPPHRLPSRSEGQAMVRLPAAGSVKSQEAELGVRKRPKRPAVGETRLGRRGDAPDKRAGGSADRRELGDGVDGVDRDHGAEGDHDERVEGAAVPADDRDDDREDRRELAEGSSPEEDEPEDREDRDDREDRGADTADTADGDEGSDEGRAEPEEDDRSAAERGEAAVREPPEGTPPAIARVFRRLPVSVHDGPPLEGIGASGIHIDKIWLGSKQNRRGCSGKSDNFSVKTRDEVNVCFRVVHGRVEEDVDVIWEREGDLAKRRRGVTIPAAHAYRSRSYLVLRNEYVGSWRVRIYSVDGVELASTTFKVVD